MTVTITDANEAAPVFADGDTASANAAENQQAVGTYAASDADGDASLTYTIVTSGDNAASVDHDLFSVANGGVLTFANAPNYEAPGCGAGNDANTCVVVIKVSDGLAGTDDDTITVTVTVTDANEAAPVFADGDTGASTPNEGSTAAGTYAASDADGTASLTYSIVTSGDNAASVDHDLFSVANGGVLTFNSAPDFETPGCGAGNDANTCVVVIKVSDGLAGSADDTITVTVTVQDVNDEDPAFTSSATPTIAENVQNVVVLAATDADAGDSVTFAITGGADADLFEIDSDTQLRFKANSVPDYESSTADGGGQDYVVIVTASDSAGSANTAAQTITVTITDANEAAPVFADGDSASANAAENQQAVGTYAASDADGSASLTYSIVTSDDNAASVDHDLFSVANGGVLTFANAPDFETPGCGAGNDANTCVVVIKVSDGVAGTDDDTITVTVTITDANEAAPVFADGDTGASTPNEGSTAAGTYAASDADGSASLTYSIVDLRRQRRQRRPRPVQRRQRRRPDVQQRP